MRSGTALIASLNTPKAPYLIQKSFAFAFVVAVAVVLGFPRFPLIHRAYSCPSCFHDSCISCFLIRRGRGGPPLRTGGPLCDSGRSTVFYREVQKRVLGGPPRFRRYSRSSQGAIYRKSTTFRGRAYREVHPNRPPPANNTGRSTLSSFSGKAGWSTSTGRSTEKRPVRSGPL